MLLRRASGYSPRTRRHHAYPFPDGDDGCHALDYSPTCHADGDRHRQSDPHGDRHAFRATVQDANADGYAVADTEPDALLNSRSPDAHGHRHTCASNGDIYSITTTDHRYPASTHGDSRLMPPTDPNPQLNRLRQALLELAAVPGPPGYEAAVREELHKLWEPLSDHLQVSRLGDLMARIDGTGPSPRPALALVAHMDTIGFVVTRIDGGFVHIAELGRADQRVLIGQTVTVLGRQPLEGIIVRPPDSVIPEDQRDGMLRVDQLMVDLGRDEADVADMARVGDVVVFDEHAQALGDDLVIGPGLDNRSSLVAVTEALTLLHEQRPAWDVWALATSREEQSLAGAATAGFGIAPQIALVADTTFGRGPQDDGQGTFPLGSGITNGVGPVIHPVVHQLLADAAERAGAAMVDEVLPDETGTDADALQVAGSGIPTGLIGLPIRNMHTCVEMLHLGDLAAAAQVLAELAGQLDESTLTRLETAFSDE